MKWFNTLSHNRWLEQETDRILDFGKHAAVPTGFGWLGNNGQVRPEMNTHLWITARMVHVYAVAASMGRPGAYDLVEHGIDALNGPLKDQQYGGWYACVNDEGVVDASKQGYQHLFVLLGAASAVTTGHPKAQSLLDEAIEVTDKYFWSEEEQMCLESWDEAFSETEDYRGGNANMHAVEAFLIVYDVTQDRKWLDRALRITSVIIHDVTRNNEYLSVLKTHPPVRSTSWSEPEGVLRRLRPGVSVVKTTDTGQADDAGGRRGPGLRWTTLR